MWRFWKQGIALLALAAAVGLWCLSATLAAAPGSNGGGVIYFSYGGDLWTMNDDGRAVNLARAAPPPSIKPT